MGGTPGEDGEISKDPLDLATAVFKCTEGHNYLYPLQYVFGWDEIASHHCLPETEGTVFYYRPESTLRTAPVELIYSPEIANVIKKLARIAGLDAATATAGDFDEKNLRFGCDSCMWFKESGRYYQPGYSWRNLVKFLLPSPVGSGANCRSTGNSFADTSDAQPQFGCHSSIGSGSE
jgi:hypothetical protein